MKLLAPITVIIAAASARQIYNTQSVESYANSAELYQSALEHQQRGLYSSQSEHAGYEVANHRPAEEKHAKILAYHAENDGHHYAYAYETENGIKAEEAGETLDKGTAAHGAFSYKGDDGQVYTITYTADENGFRPSGAHLPTPPPVPEEILKSLEQNAKDEAAGIFDDGKYHHEHHDLGYQEHHQGHQQQYEGGHQSSIGYHSSGHSGADLAFHAHAPAAHGHASAVHAHVPAVHSAPKLVYQAPANHVSTVSHQSSSGHSYFTPSGHSGHQESGHIASLGQQASAAEGAKSAHYISFGHEGNSGHHVAISHGGNAHQESSGHGATLQSGFHVSSGHAISNLGYSAPSGFSMPSAHSGISGHVGMSYLPPAGHVTNYSHQ